MNGETPFALVLDDPTDNCYISSPHGEENDPNMKIEFYKRTDEQNAELGLDCMETEDTPFYY